MVCMHIDINYPFFSFLLLQPNERKTSNFEKDFLNFHVIRFMIEVLPILKLFICMSFEKQKFCDRSEMHEF